jgi:hypothetical protein
MEVKRARSLDDNAVGSVQPGRDLDEQNAINVISGSGAVDASELNHRPQTFQRPWAAAL